MAGYTSGKFGLALCDQCGQQFKLNDLKKEWTGFKVCDECYEPKHPQLEPKRSLNEPQALLEPRPESRLGVNVYVGDAGDSSFASIGMQPMPLARPLVAGAMLGTVTTSIT
jgi:NAD-dependent SIR2 family protein deacetylase